MKVVSVFAEEGSSRIVRLLLNPRNEVRQPRIQVLGGVTVFIVEGCGSVSPCSHVELLFGTTTGECHRW